LFSDGGQPIENAAGKPGRDGNFIERVRDALIERLDALEISPQLGIGGQSRRQSGETGIDVAN
jgi:hypothetical protein